MRKKNQEWRVSDYRIVTVEPVNSKEEKFGFFGWAGLIVLGLFLAWACGAFAGP